MYINIVNEIILRVLLLVRYIDIMSVKSINSKNNINSFFTFVNTTFSNRIN